MNDTPESPENPNPDPPSSGRRPCNKIARLPKAIRDQLNFLLADGLPYEIVIEQLGEPGKALTKMDISRWMHSGHPKWVKQQAWLDHVESTFEVAKDMVAENKAISIHEANLHIAATAMNESMLGCDLTELPGLLKEKPENVFSILAAIPRYAHQALNFHKYREACANARIELQKLKDPARTLSDAERQAILDKVDEILGLK